MPMRNENECSRETLQSAGSPLYLVQESQLVQEYLAWYRNMVKESTTLSKKVNERPKPT